MGSWGKPQNGEASGSGKDGHGHLLCLGQAQTGPLRPCWQPPAASQWIHRFNSLGSAPQLLERVQRGRIGRKVEWAEVELSRQPLVQIRKLRLEHR